MSEYKKPIDLTPCAPHLIAVHFADESYTATPCQQKMLCDDLWMRWNKHERLVGALRDCVSGECDLNDIHNARALLAELDAGEGGGL